MPNLTSLTFFIPELVLSATALVLLLMSIIKIPLVPPFTKGESVFPPFVKGGWGGFAAILGLLAALFFVLKGWGIGNPPLFWGMLVLDKPAEFFKVIFIVTALLVVIFSRKSRELFPLLCKEGKGEVDPACRQAGIYPTPAFAKATAGRPTLPLPFDSAQGRQRGGDASDPCEYFALLVGSVVGMCLLAQANNILMIYLSLEFVSLMSYLMVGYVRGSARSNEAALKYVLYGAIASGVFLYGASLYYGMTGTLDLQDLLTILPSHHLTVLQLSGIFMLAGFLYKIAAVPMHAWCPDAYEGAPTPITAFLSVAPKAAGFAVLMRVASMLGVDFGWPALIAVIAAVTMTFGNLVAIPQMNLKRLLAYSSIAHAGYLLMGIACNTPRGNEAVYFYFIAYLIMNLGAFLVVQIVRDSLSLRVPEGDVAIQCKSPLTPLCQRGERGDFLDCFANARNDNGELISAYSGLGRRGPYGAVLGITMTIFLLSLTGIPPFFGFIGKFYLFSAVIDAKLYWLALIGIANSVISLYYYMRIVKAMFFESPSYLLPSPLMGEELKEGVISHGEGEPFPAVSKSLAIILIALALATVIFGLAWQPMSNIVAGIIQ